MADGVNIDWSLAKPQQDFTDTYANAFALGRQIAGQRIQGNALAAYAAGQGAPGPGAPPPAAGAAGGAAPSTLPMTPETPATGATLPGQVGTGAAPQPLAIDPRLAAVNPELYFQLQNRQQDAQDQALRVRQAQAEAAGDTQGAMGAAAQRGATGDVMTLKAQIDALPEQQRAAAAAQLQQTNEAFAHVLIGLKGATNPDGSAMTPQQRLGAAQHLATTTGLLDPSKITLDDVTDAGINGHLATAMTIEQYTKQVQADADLAERTRAHDLEHTDRQGTLRVEQGRLGVEQSKLALDRQKYQATVNPGMPAIPGADGSPQAVGRGQATIAQVPEADRPIVQALIDGRYPIPSGAALRNPQMVKYLQEAAAVDPTFDVANAATRVATRKDFTSGKSAQTITALNTALGHATDVAGDIQHLPGTAASPLNMVINGVTDPFTGNTTAFKMHASALATEAAKVFQAGAPHESEVKRYIGILGDPNASGAQMRSAVQSLTELLGSRLDAMKSQYTQGMGKSSTPLEVLHPDAAAAYARLSHLRTSLSPAPAQAAPPGHGAAPGHSPEDAALLAKYGVH